MEEVPPTLKELRDEITPFHVPENLVNIVHKHVQTGCELAHEANVISGCSPLQQTQAGFYYSYFLWVDLP